MARSHGIFGIGAAGGGDGKSLRLSGELAKAEAWSEAILPADGDAVGAESETNRRPVMVFAGILCVGVAILGLRLAALQLVNGGKNLAIADNNRIREVQTRAPRGLIYDSTGTAIIAKNQPAYDVTVTSMQLPQTKPARELIYAQVAAVIGMTAAEVEAKSEPSCLTEAACTRSYQPQLVKAGIERNQALLFDQESSGLTGFALDVNPIREYDDVGHLLAPFLGYTGRINADELAANPGHRATDLIGKGGLESSYEVTLKGQDGYQQTEVDALQKPVKVLASKPSVPGNSLVLSIDQGLEQEMAKDIQEQMTASGAKRAAGVAINPKTGAILAAVSLPTYDNNAFAQGISQAGYAKLVNDPGQPLFDKVTNGTYPSGSIIKPLIASAALQEGIINTSTTINDTASITIPNENDPTKPGAVYHSWETNHGLGLMNIFSALAQSSDIFFYEVAGGFTNFTHFLGVTKLTHYYQLFGLGAKTGVDLPSESVGRVPTPAWKQSYSGSGWYTGDTYNIAVGQGDLLVTPLQMATAIAAVANGGNLLKPYFVDRVMDASGNTLQQTKPQVVRATFISPANLAIVRQGMLMVTQDAHGTACCRIKADVPVLVAGKTGTAEVGTTAKPALESWFTSFSPYNDPQIVTVVFLEKAGEGATYAAPATREILKYYYTQGSGKQFVSNSAKQ